MLPGKVRSEDGTIRAKIGVISSVGRTNHCIFLLVGEDWKIATYSIYCKLPS